MKKTTIAALLTAYALATPQAFADDAHHPEDQNAAPSADAGEHEEDAGANGEDPPNH